MNLVPVYERPDRLQLLWNLLSEREPEQNISHREMPSWERHSCFVERKPYEDWCFIEDGKRILGAVYLTSRNEIGVQIYKEHQGSGAGPWAVDAIMLKHGKRRYLANVSPRNLRSANMFCKLGFNMIQATYAKESV